jgi:2-methylcitrate dehydratase PrpD
VFDHGHTIFRAFSRAPHPERLIDRLGERFDGIMELAIKPYSCVSFLHPALDALLGIVRERDLKPADIARLTLRFPRAGIHCVDDNPLKSHCAQYILPVAVANRELRVADIFIDQRIGNPAVAELCRRVTVEPDDALDELFPDFYASIVAVETRAGETIERRNDIARGYPEAPLGTDELDRKFAALVGSVAPAARAAGLRAALDGLPTASDLGDYAAALAAPVGRA